jgi:REP element-mobilizing transposase RayT
MSQSLVKIYIHATFSTKNCDSLIDDAWRNELFNVIGGNINDLDCQSLVVGGVTDHAHLLFELGRTISVADALRKIKSSSSSWVHQNHSHDFNWQAGYAAFSVSHSNIGTVRDYILRQAEHHARQSFKDELRELLRRHEIEWDERYLWD